MPRGKTGETGKTETSKNAESDKADIKRTTFALPKAQYRALKVYSAQHDMEMSAVVSEALKKMGIE